MKNPVQPTTSLALAGATYELSFEFEAVALAEELTDRPLLTGLRSRDISTPTIGLVRAMFFACLHSKYPAVTYEQAKALVTRKNLAEVWAVVLNAWTAGLAEPDEDEVETADPNPAQS